MHNFELAHVCTTVSCYPTETPRARREDLADDLMVLHVDSEAMYIVQEGACGHIAGHYILSSHPTPMWQIPKKAPNAPILIECTVRLYAMLLRPWQS